ncbi:MAG: aspartate-semialdehyde dehydrogenase [Bacteroidetes bacterium]|jgi:aspartate-semialdehyde dehydrogenase|nr:aspartate-semialdehyde dehydrogenase [Bacteroidota bacterium]
MQRPYRVGILGATGAVGQKFVEILEGHPWFEITVLAASERSAGKPYRTAANWIGTTPIPKALADREVVLGAPGVGCDFVFSGLSSSVAGEIERTFAEAGYPVISNARNYRMEDDVPLLIPEVNPDHAALIDRQQWPGGGFIVTNPNCSTVGLVCALKPLVDAFGVEQVQVTTLQALSGAGYPGVASLDALGNVVPYIGGEEEKMVAEPRKLLGTLRDGRVDPATLTVSAQCNRVPVLDGHMLCVSVKLAARATPDAVRVAFEGYQSPIADLNLPSAPDALVQVFDEPHFPQPRRHAEQGQGMKVSIGRIRPCEVLDTKFVALVHNTVRGAAGGAVLNAELLVERGYLAHRAVKTSTASA